MNTLILTLALATSAPTDTIVGGVEVTNIEWHNDGATPAQARIWSNVRHCVGARVHYLTPFNPAELPTVRWATGDRLTRVATGQQLFGAAHGVLTYDGRAAIILDTEYRDNYGVVAHEILHVLGFDHGDRLFTQCTGAPR